MKRGIFVFVIGIGGGTCSGKTTLSHALADYYGDRAAVIHMDKYLRLHTLRTVGPYTGKEYVEHNHPDAINKEDLLRDFAAALSGDAEIVIVEGLFALWFEEIRTKCDLKLFVDLRSDERLVRRIRRFGEAGQSFDDIVSRYIDTVRFRHDEFVEPTRWYADMVVNGMLPPKTVEIITAYTDSRLSDR